MWVWLVVIFTKKEWLEKCSDPVDLFGMVYFILGAIGIFMIGVAILGWICGLVTPKPKIGTGLDRGIYDATDDVDFNPYDEY